jgi:hypothetical protein
MHVRFAFHGGNNPSHRDGWMIDDVNYAVLQCDGSIAESSLASFRTSPNPLSNFATLKLDLSQAEPFTLELLRSDGALVLREFRRNTGTQTIDISRMADGPYLLRVSTDTRQTSERIIVQH